MEIIVHRNVTSDDYSSPAKNESSRAAECEVDSSKWTILKTADGFNLVGGRYGGRNLNVDLTFPKLAEAIRYLMMELLRASLSVEQLRKTSVSIKGRDLAPPKIDGHYWD